MRDREVLDLSWVTPQLAVGGSYPIGSAEHMARALGIGHVVDLRVEECDDELVLERHGIELLHLPTRDTCAVSLSMLDDGVAWVGERLDRGGKVFVHCQHGIGRSALLVLCVLVSRGDGPLRALERAKGARSRVSPSPDQLEAFRAWVSSWRARTGAVVTVPRFDELAYIAYRHLREAAEAAEAAAAHDHAHGHARSLGDAREPAAPTDAGERHVSGSPAGDAGAAGR